MYYKFTSEAVGCVVEGTVVLGVEHHLSDAVTVAEVDKCHAAHFAYSLYPAGESDLAAGVGEAKLAAGIGPEHFMCVLKLQLYLSKTIYLPVLDAMSIAGSGSRPRLRRRASTEGSLPRKLT